MLDGLDQMWINAVIEDFPEFGEALDRLDKKIDLQFELIEDYYICKQQIKLLENSKKAALLKEYTVAFDDLKEDIRLMLSEI